MNDIKNITVVIEDKGTIKDFTGDNTIVYISASAEIIDGPLCHYGPEITLSDFKIRTFSEDYDLQEAEDFTLIENVKTFESKINSALSQMMSRGGYENDDEIYIAVGNGDIGKKMSIISITASNILEVTKKLLLNDHADYSAVGSCSSGLFFNKETLESLLEEDFFSDEERPSADVLNQIKKLLKEMEDADANFLFLN